MGIEDIAQRLALEQALVKASKGNDLLPPRWDAGVGGQVAARFEQALLHRLETGGYAPSPTYLVSVPKSGHTTRPAAVLTLEDHTVFEALVDRIGDRLERHLLSTEVVFAHRIREPRRSWTDFEQAPLSDNPTHIVLADIFGYYESIQHDVLLERLLRIAGDRTTAESICTFLTTLMGRSRGLPQGISTSDALATVYFDQVDRSMVRHGYSYFRYGDDVRLSVESYEAGREAIARLEATVRRIGLSLNGSKTRVLRAETYRNQLNDADTARVELQRRLHESRLAALETTVTQAEGLSELEGVLTDEMLWSLYAGDVDIQDVIDEMTPLLEPADIEVAEELFKETLDHAPWTHDPLRREAFHGRFVRTLRLLTSGRSRVGVEHAIRLLRRLPDQTEEVARYLAAIARDRPNQVRKTVRAFLLSDAFRQDWQEVWLYDVLSRCLPLGASLVTHLEAVADDEDRGWFVRTSSMNLLARDGKGQRSLAARMWELAPTQFRTEIIAAATWREGEPEWQRLLDGCRGDPIHDVVANHVRQARDQPP